ncbi:MAG: hypothetical protein ACLFPL_02500 [Candidatus Nanoarchaeia archaeon]
MEKEGKPILKYVAYSLSVCSILVLLIPFLINFPFELNNSNGFGDYLGLITGLTGVIVTITVFLIQNTSQDYSSQLMRMTFFKQKYFGLILGYIFCSLVLYTFGTSFEVINTVKVFAFFVSVGLVFNFISLLVISSYFMNILNVIKEIESKTTNYIKFKAEAKSLPLIGKISLNEISTTKVINQIRPIFDTLNKSVALNQDDVSTQCLNSLNKIIKTYLKETRSYKSLDDKILIELADQSSFIVKTMIKYENQKFMDKFPLFLGDIGSYALENRYNVGGINNHAISISRLLVETFIKCYKFDRTSAPKHAISGITKLVKKCIQKEYYQSASTYYYDIKEIMDLCVKNPSFWSANLIQYALNDIKDIINECVIVVQNKKNVELHFLRNIFSDIFEVIKKSNETFSSINYDLIVRAVFNLESILVKISKAHPQLPVYKKVPYSILNPIIDSYIGLCKKMLENKSIKLDFMFFHCVPEFIFLTQYIQKTESRFDKKHSELLNSLLKRLKSELENSDHNHLDNHYFYTIEDYFAIIIYSENVPLCETLLELLIKFYESIKDSKKIKARDKKRVYGLLKLIGAFMHKEKKFDLLKDKIIKTIIKDFEEPKIIGRAIPSFFEQYGYPTFKHTFSDWYIHPLSIWTQDFQERIKKFVNKKDYSKFTEFHEILKKKDENRKNG